MIVLVLATGCAPAEPDAGPEPVADVIPTQFDTAEYGIRLVTIADGLAYPYSMVFLPDGNMLFTEMGGQLRMVRDGVLQEESIPGIPEVFHDGPSKGLMDIALHPDFAENSVLYFTYDKQGEDGVTEALGRGVFSGTELTRRRRRIHRRRLGRNKRAAKLSHHVCSRWKYFHVGQCWWPSEPGARPGAR